jgi:hypothetical protein
LSKAIMLETQTIAETFGVKFRVDVERRIEGARKVGAHKTSMLQDLERGRPMEIDPLVTVVQEMGRLTTMAGGSRQNGATTRMVEALLSNEVDDKLEPLRATLNLGPTEFSEGVFSWRGFIYYKWCLDESWPNLIRALRGIKAMMPIGRVSSDERKLLEASKNVILRGAKANSIEIRRIIGIYDHAYAGMIERQDPKLFREFLLGAPKLFLDIGERMGAISHITSFWNYRFPVGAPRAAHADELIVIFQDFSRGMATEFAEAA